MSNEILGIMVAYRNAVQIAPGIDPRLQLETAQAVALAKHLADTGTQFRHQAKVAEAVALWAVMTDPEREKSAPGSDAAIAEGVLLGKLTHQFWDAFEGEVVEGVEILRKRA
jgi:hypothetical protein